MHQKNRPREYSDEPSLCIEAHEISGGVGMAYSVPFLILGLTGPIGSGCTTLANNIQSITIKRWIKKHGVDESVNNQICNISKDMRSSELTEEEMELKHKELLYLLEERSYLNVLLNSDDTKFQYISMSNVIIKIAIDNVNSKEFKIWKKGNEWLADILEKTALEYAETLKVYNRKNTTFKSLSADQSRKVDFFLKRLQEIRTQVRQQELQLYLQGKIENLYLQDFGDNIRQTGNPFRFNDETPINGSIVFIAEEVNRLIKYYRNSPSQNKHCFVIDAFRNPAEVEFFRRRYEQFHLISLYAERKTRENRLKKELEKSIYINDKNFSNFFDGLDKRDLGTDINFRDLHKQNVARCSYLSDIDICNNEDVTEFNIDLFKKFLRVFALMVSPGCTRPTKEETFMNLAYSLSLRSSCTSRQVGAVITDKYGYVLGMGWNDACHGQIGCGLKNKGDFLARSEKLFSQEVFESTINEKDLISLHEGDAICFKDILSEKLVRNKLVNKGKKSIEEANNLTKIINIKRLEYCRAPHAEENAILQIASRGGIGVKDGVIYTTTFPCELCAKKIYQSGIKKIVYTEPYPNNKSEILLSDGIRRIEKKQFEGVKSFSYFKLFKPLYDKKEAQKLDTMF
jgi:deoxycytidylate deaminase